MTSAHAEARSSNFKLAFNFTIIYTIISLTWLLSGQAVKRNIEGIANIKTLTETQINIINVLLSSLFIFAIIYMVLKRFNTDQTIMNNYLKELKIKSVTLEKADMDLKNQKELIYNVLESADVLIVRIDKEFNITKTSHNIEGVTSFSSKEVKGKSLNMLISQRYIEEIKENIKEKEKYELEVEVDTKYGEKVYMYATIKTSKVNDNDHTAYNLVLCDISERKILQQKVSYLDSYDPITSLPNRNLLEKVFNSLLPTMEKAGKPVALLYIDIDDFAYINETLGHHAGDHLLMDMANKLILATKSTDILARITQDRFVVILTDEKSLDDIEQRVNQILKDSKMSWKYEEDKYMISNTIGVSIYPYNGKDFTSLLRNANIALECAKESSRTSYEYYSPDNNCGAINEHTMVSDIKLALENKDFQMYYQPIRNLETGKIENVESLIRWFHPEKGYIPPDKFIPIAERLGIIDQIGEYTLEEVFLQKKKWNNSGFHLEKVSINISAISFSKSEFSKYIKEKLQRYELKGEEIVLELTETSFSTHRNKIKKNIEELRSYGIQVAMDDFGTGYSSLARLKDLQIDYLKLDRLFIVGLIEEDGQEIIKPLISLANALGKKVIAEGIETEEQFDILKKLGCSFGQGYFLSRPMPAIDLIAL